MFGWGLGVFIGLVLIFWDLNPTLRAKLLGNPILIHFIVVGSGFWLHGGSAMGAMAAVMSGVFAALYMRIARRMYGYISKGEWHPGALRAVDPRLERKAA